MIDIAGFIENNRFLYILLYPLIRIRRCFLGRAVTSNDVYYDRLFQQIEGGRVIVRVPDYRGSFEMDIRSHILKRILVTGQFEPDLVGLVHGYIDEHKDVIDIGANIGLYTILFSKIVGRTNKVLAIEPVPLALRYLRNNIQRNNCSDVVIVYKGIATNIQGNYRINMIPGLEEYSSIGEIVHPSVQGENNIPIQTEGDTVDNIVATHSIKPGFIKIDVEGSEYSVFLGAIKTIKKYRPVIITELSDILLKSCGATPEMVLNILQQNDYSISPTIDGILALPTK